MAKKIPYGHQWIDKKDIANVVKILKSDWLTQGPEIEKFEKAVARFCGAKYACAVSSGTAGLYIAYKAAGIKDGDEVITTPLTFAATSNMMALLGAKPVFVDIDPETLNINSEDIKTKINGKTKAIVPVDFAGHPCDYDKILKIAKENNLLVIEDACHALGAEYKGRKIGSISDLTVLSFHPVKHITTGEGGMVLTNNEELYKRLKLFRNHGIVKKPENGAWYYEIEEPSFNFRITDFQSALGNSQLKKLNQFIQKRRNIVKIYQKELRNVKSIKLPVEKDSVKHAWHLYPIQVSGNRREIFDALQKNGIGCQVHYIPLHLHPFYKSKFGYKKGDFPKAENYYEKAITLPLFPAMTLSQISKVVKEVKKIGN